MQNDIGITDIGKFRALVVDDDSNIVSLITMVLNSMGVGNCERAADGETALEMYRHNPAMFDFIICDWMMPGMSGLELFLKVKKINPEIPFMLLTSKKSEDAVRTAVESGVRFYLAKPFTQDALQKRVLAMVKKVSAIHGL